MTLLLRSLQTISSSFFKPKVESVGEIAKDRFRVLPTDIDAYRHMNNAKYLNYMEAARWGYMMRIGFIGIQVKQGWISPIASMQIDFYRPLKMGQRFELTTQFVHFEEKWFYVLHRFWSGEKEMARALIKGTVRQGRKNIPPSQYLAALGFKEDEVSLSSDVSAWVDRHIKAES